MMAAMKVNLSLTDADTITEYHENGVCVVRNLISPEWIVRMGAATDRILTDPSPGSMEYTPLHQDLPYWPIRGQQIISIWAGFDPVTEQAGAVQYIRGDAGPRKID